MMLQCLVYACQVEPIVPEQGVVSLVKLLHGMAKDFPGKLIKAHELLHSMWNFAPCWAQSEVRRRPSCVCRSVS